MCGSLNSVTNIVYKQRVAREKKEEKEGCKEGREGEGRKEEKMGKGKRKKMNERIKKEGRE